MGLGTSVLHSPTTLWWTPQAITMINNFTPIKVKDLPAAVQEAILGYAESTIKEAAVKQTKMELKLTKVVLTDKEGTESTALFPESGKF